MKNRNRTILFSFLLFISIFCSWSYSVSADVTYNNTTFFNVDNENYTFPAGGMTFSQVMINESGSWIKFNDTDFNITSTNPINISLSYLDDNFSAATSGDTVLTYTVTVASGKVWFNLSGFKSSTNYTVYRDSAAVKAYETNSDGNISYNNSVWGSDFEIKEGDQTGTADMIKVSYTFAQQQSRANTTGILIVTLTILILSIILLIIMQIKNGEFNILLTSIMLTMAVAVIVVFAVLSIGTYMNDEISGSLIETETFTVTPDGTDQTFDLTFRPDTLLEVEVRKSSVWSDVSSSDYWLDSDNNLVVRASVF